MYTKEQRHEIYVEALAIYNTLRIMGMCYPIECAIYKMGLHIEMTETTLPEFHQLKPGVIKGLYWWPKNEDQIRIDNFKKIIEQTKP